MEKHETGESVKAGLQPEAGPTPLKRKRKRIPLKKNEDKNGNGHETMHEHAFQAMTGHYEHDIDGLVQSEPPIKTVGNSDEQGSYDLVHQR